MIQILKYIFYAVKFLQLPATMRRVVFYSESESYWPLFEGIINQITLSSNVNVCYITSDKNDPGYWHKGKNYRSFITDSGYVRNWLFRNIDTEIIIMTTPDLDKFQVKRSKHNVHYIYIQHALMSLHMAYRFGAFDHYDAIFCAGHHHIKEIRAMEKKYKTPKKILVKHGYARLDSILKGESVSISNKDNLVIFAPSWGPNGLVELGMGIDIVDKLLGIGCKVIFRPHPETRKLSIEEIDKIVLKFYKNKMFIYEDSVSSIDSFFDSDFVVTDWSGIALEYAIGTGKPVVFINSPRKINNPKYTELGITPFEVCIRDKIGVVIKLKDINKSLFSKLHSVHIDPEKYVYNIGSSDYYGAKYILNRLG